MTVRGLKLTAILALCAGALPFAAAPADAKRAKLPAFQKCSDLVDFGQRAAMRPPLDGWLPAIWETGASIDPRVPRPDPGPPPQYDGRGGPPPIAMPAVAEAAGAPGGGEASSGTNVQEAGVDEPDAIKVAGSKVFLIAGKELLVVETAGAAPQIAGRLALPAAGGALLLKGNRLLTIGPSADGQDWSRGGTIPGAPAPRPPGVSMPLTAASSIAPPPRNPGSLLQEVDVSDPAAPRLLRSMAVPGTIVSARMSDGVARVVVNSVAALPAQTSLRAGVKRQRAKRLTRRSFVPRTLVSSRVTGKRYRRDLVRCGDVRHPVQPTGTNLVSVLSVNMDRGLINVERDAILASAQTVYASTGALYIGASRAAAVDPAASVPTRPVTELHRFAYTAGGETAHSGGGTVRGVLLNSYSLSEHRGMLRVATSDAPLWWNRADDANQLTVLETKGATLSQTGFVGELGKGERIYAARMIGDRGYLVTFRRTDPLYVLDLSDPAAPKMTGELKINGYSAYLHPVGDDLLLGVGQDGTAAGALTGAQLSLVDVKDPSAPTRIAQYKPFADGVFATHFLTEHDPHAFLWWPRTGHAMVPTGTAMRGWGQQAAPLVSVVPSRAGGLREAGRLEHGPAWDHPSIERVAVAAGKVVAISDLGISTADPGTLAPQSYLPLAG